MHPTDQFERHAGAPFLRRARVLYVEDEPVSREETRRILGRWAGEVVVAADGAEGLHAYGRCHPDLIVTDLQMPAMDGLAMIRAIRARDRAIPIIVTTAFETTAFLKQSLDLGVDKFVLKPLDGDQLHQALLDCAGRIMEQAELEALRLRQEDLAQARHQEAQNLLARGLAHDFNNMLQATVSCLSLAKQAAEPGSPVAQILAISDGSTARARELGQRLGFLIRGCTPPREVAALEPLLQEAVLEELDGTGVCWTCAFPGPLPPVRVDPMAMKDVFRHLLRNAVEAMPGGGQVRIQGQCRTLTEAEAQRLPQGPYVALLFQDTGRGIAAADLHRLFDPYFTTKALSSHKGTGLGLTLCDRVLRAHGGLIRAASPPGEGAAFTLLLPVPEPLGK